MKIEDNDRIWVTEHNFPENVWLIQSDKRTQNPLKMDYSDNYCDTTLSGQNRDKKDKRGIPPKHPSVKNN